MRADSSSFAKIDPAHILDGLFVPRRKEGESLFGVEGKFKNGIVSFKGVQLSVTHQSVLLAIAARTGRQQKNEGLIVNGSRDDLLARQMSLLRTTGPAADQDISRVECSAYALLKDAGMGSGKSDYMALKNLLHEMSTVVLRRDYEGKSGTSHLLSYQSLDDHLMVSLNWRMTDAIFGGQNIQVSLHERQELTGPVAKILHTWLSAYINKGASLMAGRGASVDTLVNHVYGKRPCKSGAKRRRKQYVVAALKEINNLEGWGVQIENNRANIRRSDIVYVMEDIPPGDMAEAEAFICSLDRD